MIVVTDVNTLWRRKPFEALGELIPVLGVKPRDPVASWREYRSGRRVNGTLTSRPVSLPPGWASKTAGFSQWVLWHRISAMAGGSGNICALVVTSPHYFPLVRRVVGTSPVFYYCCDDYRSYDGWPAGRMAAQEEAITELVEHAFFVSHGLARRALDEYGLCHDRVSVSMNATDPAFLADCDGSGAEPPLVRELARPIAGVVGRVSCRLDWNLLRTVAELPSLGTLLFVGPVESSVVQDESFREVRGNPKTVFAGPKPHRELPVWMQALDVALIPYKRSTVNRFCSPMRLFDHLASGRPIIATDTCDQLARFSHWVTMAPDRESFAENVTRIVTRQLPLNKDQIDAARQHLWNKRAQTIAATMDL